ncbi:MAG: Gx transporter family protein [Clostridiales bacterium]|nr:Gx transporter family protein [Clostridiales bacterium]
MKVNPKEDKNLQKSLEAQRKQTRRLAYTGLLFALTLTFSYLESFLPPLGPFPLKYGLANTPIILAILDSGLPLALVLTLLKSAFALATRGAMAALLSLAGGLAAALIMWLADRTSIGKISLYLLSAVGALSHNTGQLGVLLVLYGENMQVFLLGLFPLLLILALASAWITAILTHLILKNIPTDFESSKK